MRHFVFDIGNVLVDWHTRPFVKQMMRCTEEESRALAQMVFEGEEWRKGDEGVLSRAEIRTALFEKYPVFQSEIGKLLDQAEEILTEYAFNTAVLQKLKEQGFGVYYLSNTNEPAFSHMISTCRFFRWMDGGVASFRCRLLKPSRAIFDFFLKQYRLDPAECCFVDDNEANTRAASEIGFRTITLKNPEDLPGAVAELTSIEHI